MPRYRVEIETGNLLVELEGRLAKYGFVTYRVVDAESAESAVEAAVQSIRDDSELHELLQNDSDDPPTIDVGAIHEVNKLERSEIQLGRVWYEMDPKRWWQIWRS